MEGVEKLSHSGLSPIDHLPNMPYRRGRCCLSSSVRGFCIPTSKELLVMQLVGLDEVPTSHSRMGLSLSYGSSLHARLTFLFLSVLGIRMSSPA